MLIAAIHHQTGRADEARAVMAKAIELWPGSTAANIAMPTKNASPIFLEAAQRVRQMFISAGLPAT
jgi:hypothetical protein